MPKPLSKLVRKPRRIQTGFRETKRTIVVARYPGVEVNNATHHVGETRAAPRRRCKSHPPRAILPDLFVPFRRSDVYPIFRAIGDSIFPFCDRSCLSIFHYAVLGKYNMYSRGVRQRYDSISIYALWMHREFEKRYCGTTIRRHFDTALIKSIFFKERR